jgi:hypothetical protein
MAEDFCFDDAAAEAGMLDDEDVVICDRCGWELGTKDGCPNCYPPDGDPADARC